jgi:hypothetical protein
MSGLSTKEISSRRTVISELKEKHFRLLQQENIEGTPKFIPKYAYTPKSGNQRVIAFFLSELLGGQDIYTEFVSKELVPQDSERTLWKWPFNPHYDTAYEKSEPHPATGHCRYIVPISELINVATGERVVEQPQPHFEAEIPEPEEIHEDLEEFDEPTGNQLELEIPVVDEFVEAITDATEKLKDPEKPKLVFTKEVPAASITDLDDAPLSEMTMRDKIAVMWNEPVSKKKWLNDLIIAKNNKNNEPIDFTPG